MPGTFITPADERIVYTGRIDFSDTRRPRFSYAGSYITARFYGTAVHAVFDDLGDWWSPNGNKVGFIIDGGEMLEVTLDRGFAGQWVVAANELADSVHTLVIVKLSGPGAGSSTLVFRGLALDQDRELAEAAPRPARRIEVYGDSVTEGEGAGCPGKKHDCGNNNGWLSYANVLARLLGAEIHNLGIGGLAVRSGTGYYNDARTGLDNTFDRVKPYGDFPKWNFSRFTPNLIIMAMGVNDASARGFNDLPAWMETYQHIVRAVSMAHGKDVPILFTVAAIETNADQAYPHVEQVAAELRQEGLRTEVYRFTFRVSGHPNRADSDAMARELYDFIQRRGLLP